MKNLITLALLLIGTASAHAASFHFDDAARYYNQGKNPEASELLGSWILVGMTKSADFRDDLVSDQYDSNGIRFRDGSIATLSFAKDTQFDDSEKNIVWMSNLGQKGIEQGPYDLDFESDGACFALWAYGGAGNDVHFDYQCRLIQANHQKLICSLIFRVDNAAAVYPEYRAFDGKTVEYFGFIKK